MRVHGSERLLCLLVHHEISTLKSFEVRVGSSLCHGGDHGVLRAGGLRQRRRGKAERLQRLRLRLDDAAAAIVAAAPVALGPELPPSPKKEPVVLPSALEMFNVVDGPPSYLTKPMDKLGYKLHAPKRDAYDVEEPRELAAKHRASATVSSAPKRYRADEIAAKERRLEEASLGDAERTLRMQRGGGDALAMAVLGAAPKPTLGGKGGRAASGAMDVGEFLTKGPGALMPRKRGGNERMDGERRKRQAGQNGRDSVEWKSEAEMVLRQQFD